ncbi:MAG: type II toxin-antitoxin system ParD family antitoxin [Caulobacteraceae bacterium]
MSTVEKRTISLPGEQAAFIDAKVAAGDYASVSEVVRAGLRALKERDEAVERWLRDEVALTFDAMTADPARGVSADSAFADVRARHAERLKGRR